MNDPSGLESVRTSNELTVERVDREVIHLLQHAPRGDDFDKGTRALAMRACGTTLALEGIARNMEIALDAGVTAAAG